MENEPVEIDWHIVERLASGEPAAMDELYDRHFRSVFAYIMTLTDDRPLAEEILQDTFVAAWNSAHAFQSRSTVRTWLFGIARRQAWNRLRRKHLNLTDDAALEQMASSEPQPESQAIARAEQAEITAAISALGALHREVLLLTFVEGLSLRETADVLSVPLGTVKSRLSNAKRELKRSLGSSKGVRQR